MTTSSRPITIVVPAHAGAASRAVREAAPGRARIFGSSRQNHPGSPLQTKMRRSLRKPLALKPPSDLNAAGRRLWAHVLHEYDLTDPAGLQLLHTAAWHLDAATTCRQTIKSDGLTVIDRFGQKKAHPLLAAERDHLSGLRSSIRALGLDLEPLHPGPGRPPER